MALSTQSGSGTDLLQGFVEAVQRAAKMEVSGLNCAVDAVLTLAKTFGEDSGLQSYLPGLLASVVVLQALNAYQSSLEPTLVVLALWKQALTQLRDMLFPALLKQSVAMDTKRPLGRAKTTKSASVKGTIKPGGTSRTVSANTTTTMTKATATSPVKSVALKVLTGSTTPILDDALTLASHLGALSSLLGVLGLTLQKVECLKVFRALFRSNPDVVNRYTESSAQLASEYADLGKMTRANTIFTQSIRLVEDNKTSIAPHVVCLLHLRHCAYLATVRRVDEAILAYKKAATLAQEIDVSDGKSKHYRQTLEWLERGVLARHAVASISKAQVRRPTCICDEWS